MPMPYIFLELFGIGIQSKQKFRRNSRWVLPSDNVIYSTPMNTVLLDYKMLRECIISTATLLRGSTPLDYLFWIKKHFINTYAQNILEMSENGFWLLRFI
ncbi:hypothetical protein BGP_2828 [Beggiatoa sp. PS]|nr:hypothetical protein BGP_2828 [Beggiatoa sp. PS]